MKRAIKAFIRYLGYDIQALPRDRHAVFEEKPLRDYRLLKSFATRAAEDSASPERIRAIREIYLTGIFQEQPLAEYSRIELGDERTIDVGIWRREGPNTDAAFTR